MHAALEWAATVDPALFHAAAVHIGVCTATVLELGRPGSYLACILRELDAQQSVGTILITELGRGNSHIAPGTQARFHPEIRSFTLHTPDPGSTKIMANVAAPGIPKTAIVHAQLLVGERPCGVFPFVVRIRTEEGPGEGTTIADLPEVPAVALDYASVSFDGTPVPYDGWLRDGAGITDTGRFTDPLPDPDLRLVRSMAFSANASMGAGVGLASAARACITVAVRYGQQRVTEGRLAPGARVLDYSTQRQALYPALAEVCAATFVVERAKTWYADKAPEAAGKTGPTWAPWAAVDSGLALAKVAATRALEKTAATCRTRSGALGLFASNRIVEYEGLAHIYQAAAGDNLLILMDTGKALAQAATNQAHAHPAHSPLDAVNPASVRSLAAAREAGLLTALREELEKTEANGTPFETWDPLLPRAVELADAHLRGLTLTAFDDAVRAAEGSDIAEALRSVQLLHALEELKRTLGWHLENGTVTAADAARVHAAHEQAVTRVHRHVPDLTGAFCLPAARLRAPMAGPDYIAALTHEHGRWEHRQAEVNARPQTIKEAAMPSAPATTPSFSLDGKNALVTGASRGIGRVIALAYAKAGANVALLARDTDALKQLATEIEAIGRTALVRTCDVASAGQITRAVGDAVAELGRVDILVNNAGTVDAAGPFLDLTFDDWVRISRVNLDSLIHFCHALGPRLVRQGDGSVINVASIAGTGGFPFLSYYAATKAAMISLTRSLAAEWAASGVRVNAITPGWHDTDLTKNFLGEPQVAKGLVRQIPAGRWGEPDEVTGAAVFLASEASKYITGTCLTVDGGQTANVGGPGMTDLLKLGRIENT
ncbi:glucose 1-dehydrogenase [Streptomyces sp. NPDC050355]|uniref:glucose 1-dehydrogenase n=1 Tax=Streptomyces sp. NPDC050355 TaxID=3365609 RepID=UPI00379A9AD2